MATSLVKMKEFEISLPNSMFLPNIFYLKGEISYWEKNYPQAESFLKQTLQKGGNLLPYTYLMLAKTMQKINNYDEANRYLSQLKKEFPNHSLSKTATNLMNEWEVNHE